MVLRMGGVDSGCTTSTLHGPAGTVIARRTDPGTPREHEAESSRLGPEAER